jgi:hypothetical protein
MMALTSVLAAFLGTRVGNHVERSQPPPTTSAAMLPQRLRDDFGMPEGDLDQSG